MLWTGQKTTLYSEEGQEIDEDKDNELKTESKGESDTDGE